MRRYLLCYALLGLLVLQSSAQAQENVSGNVLFILDASGSMWGQVDQKPKIAIAKEVMTNLVQELPEGIRAGLQVYGHRSKGDCNDIEMLVPIGAGDRPNLIAQIQALQPKGKTPITGALRQAAEQLRAVEEETSVVLVSDGKETCEGDPCALVRELRGQGIKVKVHVVGFDVNQDEREQLVCIAEAGGGRYFSADSTAQLQEALTQVKQEVVQVKPAPPPPEPPKPASVIGIQLKTVLVADGETITDHLSYEVFSAQQDLQGQRERITTSYDAEPLLKLEPGKYHLRVKHGGNESNAVSELDIEVKAGELTQQVISLDAGYVRLVTVPAAGAEPLAEAMNYEMFSAAKDLEGKRRQVAFSYDAQPVFKLKAGRYHLRASHGGNESNAVVETEVEVKANQLSEQTINLDAGYLRITAIPAEGADPLTEAMNYEMFSAARDLEGKRKQVAFSYDAAPVFKLKAGQYHLRVKHGGNESNVVAEADVEVKAGELAERTISLEAGYLRVATLPVEGAEPLAGDLNYEVFGVQQDPQGNRAQVAFSYDARPLFKLKAGGYRVTVSHGNSTATADVEVAAGVLQETTLQLAP